MTPFFHLTQVDTSILVDEHQEETVEPIVSETLHLKLEHRSHKNNTLKWSMEVGDIHHQLRYDLESFNNSLKDCFEYAESLHKNSSNFVIIVARDKHESAVGERDTWIDEPRPEIDQRGPDLLSPSIIRCGYRNIRNICFSATSFTEFTRKLKKEIMV